MELDIKLPLRLTFVASRALLWDRAVVDYVQEHFRLLGARPFEYGMHEEGKRSRKYRAFADAKKEEDEPKDKKKDESIDEEDSDVADDVDDDDDDDDDDEESKEFDRFVAMQSGSRNLIAPHILSVEETLIAMWQGWICESKVFPEGITPSRSALLQQFAWRFDSLPTRCKLDTVVFAHFHQKGKWVGSGYRFGGRFLVYDKNPRASRVHSSTVVSCLSENSSASWGEIVSDGRVANSVRKTLTFARAPLPVVSTSSSGKDEENNEEMTQEMKLVQSFEEIVSKRVSLLQLSYIDVAKMNVNRDKQKLEAKRKK